MGLDFGGIRMEASIFKDGVEHVLGLPNLPYLTEVDVEFGLGFIPAIRITLSPPYREAIAILDSKLLTATEAVVKVRFGYIGSKQFTPSFVGILQKPEVRFGADMSITLIAMGIPICMTGIESGAVYKNATRRSIVKSIFGKYGLVLDETLSTRKNKKWGGDLVVAPDLVTVSQAFKSDWMLAMSLIQVSGLIGQSVGDHKFRVASLDDNIFGSIPTKTFKMYAVPDSDKQIYPMIGFSSRTAAVYMPGGARALLMQGIDPHTKENVELNIAAATSSPLGGKTDTVSSGRTGKGHPDATKTIAYTAEDGSTVKIQKAIDRAKGETGKKMPGDPSDARSKSVAEAEAVLKEFMGTGGDYGVAGGIEGVIESGLGVADLVPGEVVAAEGVSSLFDTAYAVFKIHHTVSASGFTTTLTGISNNYPFPSAIEVGDIVRYDAGVAPVGTQESPGQDRIQVSAEAVA